jgi:hypothetical protein
MASENIEKTIESYLESIVGKDMDQEEIDRVEARIATIRKLNS